MTLTFYKVKSEYHTQSTVIHVWKHELDYNLRPLLTTDCNEVTLNEVPDSKSEQYRIYIYIYNVLQLSTPARS